MLIAADDIGLPDDAVERFVALGASKELACFVQFNGDLLLKCLQYLLRVSLGFVHVDYFDDFEQHPTFFDVFVRGFISALETYTTVLAEDVGVDT